MNQYYFFDIEVYRDYFLAAFMDFKGNIVTFELYDFPDNQLNEIEELALFYEEKKLIGFNCLNYDAQVIEWILDNKDCTNFQIFEKSQDVVNSLRPDKWESQLRNKYLDIMQVNHWGIDSAKTASLKWLQFTTCQDILDLPYHWDSKITYDQAMEIKDYCVNSDIPSTKKIYELVKPQIEIRKTISLQENVNVLNAPEPKLAKKLFSKHLREDMGLDWESFKALRTLDEPFMAKDIILPYIQFKEPIFKKALEEFKRLKIEPGTEIKKKYDWKGLHIVLGLGGIHAFREPKVWKEDAEYYIVDGDVTSFYPALSIVNQRYPRHLGEYFCNRYNQYFEERKKIPKSDPRNYVLKICINSAYGLTLDPRSFLFDRQLGMFITINGQLLLLMWCEMLSEVGDIISVNTDGILMRVRKDKIDRYYEICKEWETLTKLNLEFETFEKTVQADINNYISLTTKGKSKCKGRFEFEPFLKFEASVLHKDRSELIVPIAIHDFFVKGIPIEETIKNHTNIFDFCIGFRSKSDSYFATVQIENMEIVQNKLPKTIRYYISNSGDIIKKFYYDGREQFLNVHPQKGKSYYTTLFNKIEKKPMSEYDIDYNYYIHKARKEIDTFNINQLSLL